jgi:hypothetical protein
MTSDTAAEPDTDVEPDPSRDRLTRLVDQALMAIADEWAQAAALLDAWPDPRAALAEAGRLGDEVRALVDRHQRPLRGRQVRRLTQGTGKSIRALAREASMSHEALAKLERAADDDQEGAPDG